MSVSGSTTRKGRLAIAAAEQAGRALGPRAACSALRTLALTFFDGGDRCAALLASAEHACTLADEPMLFSLSVLLREAEPATRDAEAVAAAEMAALTRLCARLLRERRPHVAVAFAQAEEARRPRALSHYLVGRCLHGHDPDAADAAYREAEAALVRSQRTPRARHERGHQAAHRHALRDALAHQRRLLALERGDSPLPSNSASHPTADPAALLPAETAQRSPIAEAWAPTVAISDAAARLAHGGRYARATAIDELAALADDPRVPEGARRWIDRLLARHADARGLALTAVEAERLAAHLPAGVSDFVSQRVAFLRAVVADHGHDGQDQGHEDHAVPADAPETTPNVDHAPSPGATIRDQLRAQAYASAVLSLRAARAQLKGDTPPTSLYAAGWEATRSDDPESAQEGAKLLEALLTRTHRAPPRGYLPLALSLRPHCPELAALALRRAAAANEKGARDLLVKALVAEARKAYAEGDRGGALSALRRADQFDPVRPNESHLGRTSTSPD